MIHKIALPLVLFCSTVYAEGPVLKIYCDDGGQGSGTLIGSDKVLTAAHVVISNGKIFNGYVESEKGRCRFSVIKVDRGSDLALLKLKKVFDIKPAEIAGEMCGPYTHNGYSKGSFKHHPTSHLGRINTDEDLYSGDVTQGDSGGPIFNSESEVVGVISKGFGNISDNKKGPQTFEICLAVPLDEIKSFLSN